MRLHWLLFIALAGTHAVAVLAAPEALAPVLAGSVYLPLLLLESVGLTVFGSAGSGGWPSPSLLGWVAVFLTWSAIWWAAAVLLSRLLSRHTFNASH